MENIEHLRPRCLRVLSPRLLTLLKGENLVKTSFCLSLQFSKGQDSSLALQMPEAEAGIWFPFCWGLKSTLASGSYIPIEAACGQAGREQKLFWRHSVQDHDSINCGQKKMNGMKSKVLKGWWIDNTGVILLKENFDVLNIAYNPGNHVSQVSQHPSYKIVVLSIC